MRRSIVLVGAAVAAIGIAAPAQAAPQCGDTITEDTVLKKDIHCALGEPGLVIGADGVKLDLNGHTIQGDDSDSMIWGVSALGREDIQIRGGTIKGFGMSVELENGAGARVTDMKILSPEYEAIYFGGYNGATVDGNVIKGSVDNVVLDGSEEITVAGNEMKRGGVRVSSGSEHTVVRNTIEETGGFGPSARPGILAEGVEGVRIKSNEVSETAGDGISVIAGTGAAVTANLVARTEGDGIGLADGATGSRVKGNDVVRAEGHGIEIESGVASNIRRNFVRRGALVGIRNLDPVTPVVKNKAFDNGTYGIITASGPSSHDNKARGNGGPLQCDPESACD